MPNPDSGREGQGERLAEIENDQNHKANTTEMQLQHDALDMEGVSNMPAPVLVEEDLKPYPECLLFDYCKAIHKEHEAELARLRAENKPLKKCVKAAHYVRFYGECHRHGENGSNENCTGCCYAKAFDEAWIAARAGLEE